MQIEVWAADAMAQTMATLLDGGRVDVFDAAGTKLAACLFAVPAFMAPAAGAVVAHPFPAARGLADGRPARFEAFAQSGDRVLVGSAGYRDDAPAPEMKFRTRLIVEDADVLVESFVFSLLDTAGKGAEAT
jgi:hypothetical protein